MNSWCWHKWSKWKTYQFRGISYGGPGFLITGDTTPREVTETRQARICMKCGAEVHRRVANATGAMYDETATKEGLIDVSQGQTGTAG